MLCFLHFTFWWFYHKIPLVGVQYHIFVMLLVSNILIFYLCASLFPKICALIWVVGFFWNYWVDHQGKTKLKYRPQYFYIAALHRYSGITAETLREIDTRLRDVQEDIIKLLPVDAILVGQSVENDLRALKVTIIIINASLSTSSSLRSLPLSLSYSSPVMIVSVVGS